MRSGCYIGLITLLGCLYLTSCYTTFRAPRQNGLNDERNVDDSAIREDAIDRYLTPSLPEARWHDYDWIYYYQSAWWLDESQGIWGTEAASHPDPEEYRRRFPQGQYPDGGSVAAPAPTFSAPGLSKPRENTPSPAPANNDQGRRDFNSGSRSSTPTTAPAASSGNSGAKRDVPAESDSKNRESEKITKKRK